jgi:altronate dehydratase large subunit
MLAPDLERLRKALTSYACHPNVGAVVAIGLGCEQVSAKEVAEQAAESGRPSLAVVIQDAGGERAAVTAGLQGAKQMMAQIRRQNRRHFPLSEVALGTECGSSDYTSGLAANPLLGWVSDRLVEHGAAVVLSETTELMGTEHILACRAANEAVASEISRIVERVEQISRTFGVDIRGAQPTPGNMRGGITTIEEKSMGCIRKAGGTVVQGVLEYGQTITGKGLWIMDTPGQDVESVTGMVAGGTQIVAFTTGRGTPVGNPIAPVIKITANRDTAQRMAEHIDFNACDAMDPSSDLRKQGERFLRLLVAVASGKATKAERLRHMEFEISRVGPTL